MTPLSVTVKVPASTANLGPGFDTLGMALGKYLTIRLELSEQPEVELLGDNLEGLPQDQSNLIYQMAERIFAKANKPVPTFRMLMRSEIPLTRGMGSSAAAIVAGLVAGNVLAGRPFDDNQIYGMAAEIEGHPDNVGAAMFGGMVVTGLDGEQAVHMRFSPPEDLECLLVIPMFELSTEKARHVLPSQVNMKDAVHNISRSSLITAAFASGQMELLSFAMKDVLHQPYRAELIPGMKELLEGAVQHGALGAALSGAGPTMIAFCSKKQSRAAELERFFRSVMERYKVPVVVERIAPDLQGAQLIAEGDPANRSFDIREGEVCG
ncbi:homoserine kinase [Marinicrinis lubricantis]|uniref:Homoserine kinase n=1 Tax=Marinicrinis lubricantis TaxID=2086470 RepID=A0ABW1ITX5_9BACL